MEEYYQTKDLIIYHSEFVTVSFDPETPCVIWTPLGSMPSEDWKESFETGVEFVVRNYDRYGGTIHWLNDTKLINAVGRENLEWLQDNANNFTLTFKDMKIAFVYPESKLGLISIALYLRDTCEQGYKIPIGLYETKEEALEWLKSSALVLC